jgi:putative aldouronate transport system substrate-binding protein
VDKFSRRRFLGAGGALSLGALLGPTLVGCSGQGSSSGSGGRRAAWPTYRPVTGVKPDLVSAIKGGGVDAFFDYPADLVQSVASPPGDGSSMVSVVPTYSPPAGPPPGNTLWAAVNKALNMDMRLQIVPAAEYDQKLAAIAASNDLPDTLLITSMPRARQFVQAKCADLTEFLSGDNILKYPNLANLPTYAWQAMGRVDGGIYGIPLPRARVRSTLHVNRTVLDSVGAPDKWDAASFVQALQEVTGGNRYALGGWAENAVMIHTMAAGAPNRWALRDGKFHRAHATPEYEKGLAFAAELNAKKLFHPSSWGTSQSDVMNLYYAGQIVGVPGPFINFANGVYPSRVGDRFETDVCWPYGGPENMYVEGGIYGYTVFKKADPKRIELLLRVCDFLAAPFGTVENELLREGVEGKHFTRVKGDLKRTKLAEVENYQTVPFHYIADCMEFMRIPGQPEATKRAFDLYEATVPAGRTDPSVGLQSDTADRQGAALDQKLIDLELAIVSGRAKVADWKPAVDRYLSEGGQKIADELATAYAAEQGEG